MERYRRAAEWAKRATFLLLMLAVTMVLPAGGSMIVLRLAPAMACRVGIAVSE